MTCRHLRPSSGREHVYSHNLYSQVMMITWWMNLALEETCHRDTMTYSFRQVARDPLHARSHRHSWTYQGLWLSSHGPLGGKKVLWHEADSNRRPVGPQWTTVTTRPRWLPPNRCWITYMFSFSPFIVLPSCWACLESRQLLTHRQSQKTHDFI